ncbi:ABC transporter permease [Bacillus marinisedimentorum]|uniref:ABC transporter permease n=1 Tax=Bacillus marinisedimentorum TaxID=1821260 RepID=UPI0009F56E1E|nr:ABC transporter permease [Bacillus marinisedimentorum]
MFNLIANENMKVFRLKSTWIMFGVLLAIILVTGILNKYVLEGGGSENWRAAVEQENKQYETVLNQEDAPHMLKKNYRTMHTINEYRLEHDIPPVSEDSLWGTMKSSSNMISIITLFTIIIAATSVAGEFTWGTIKLLLIRPVGRSKILLSKYLSALFFALALLVAHFLFSFLTGGLLFGFENVGQPYLTLQDGNVVERSMPMYILSLYGYRSVDLLMMVTFAFMISTVFRSSALAIGLSIFLMFTGVQVVNLLSQYDWVKYILFANTDLMQYVNGVPLVEGMTMTFSIFVLAVYFVLFNAISWLIFTKRDVAA